VSAASRSVDSVAGQYRRAGEGVRQASTKAVALGSRRAYRRVDRPYNLHDLGQVRIPVATFGAGSKPCHMSKIARQHVLPVV
jgi:hypothetical protein